VWVCFKRSQDGGETLKEMNMHRTAYITGYILLSVLVLLGSGVGAAADDCATPDVPTQCDNNIFCDGSDTCGWKDIGGTLLWGCFYHSGNPCQGEPECANRCNEAKDNCFQPKGTHCEDDNNDCTDDKCDGSGNCSHIPNEDACDDGLFCNGTDTCKDGACSNHEGDPCEGGPECASTCDEDADSCFLAYGQPCTADANQCTDDLCDGSGACIHPPYTEATMCDDGLFCTLTDICVLGKCEHIGNPCASGQACANTCNEDADNCFSPLGTPCTNDGNVCTDDECDGLGDCSHIPNEDPCDDGLFCNGTDTCKDSQCSVHGEDPCLEGLECNNGTCNDDDDNCFVPEGTPCTDDGNVCTDDECDGLGNCTPVPNYAQCDDGLFCNGTDTCNGGTCSLHTGDPCAAASECTLACDEGTDVCAMPLGTPCSSDGNPCTNDVCLNGECTHSTVPGCQVCLTDGDCDDSNLCTLDKCGDRGCEHAALPGCGACSTDGDCDDKNLCTTDKCSNQVCEHTPIAGCAFCTVDDNCNDADPCTLDTCGVNGCENTPIPDCVPCTVDGDCDDGDACTLDACGPENQCNQSDATCFTAVGCAFFNGLEMDACAGERIPPAIAKLVARAGCKVEQAETHTRGGLRRVKKKLTLAQRSLAKAMNRLKKARGKKLSIPCADALSAEVGDRSTRIMALADKGNGGSQLAACTEALATGEVASLQTLGPSLCGKR
jgi:hypothetical protein